VFDDATQLYHRLISGDLDEAEDIAYLEVKQHSLSEFYGKTALPMLALAATQQSRGATAVQRQNLIEGTARFVRELQADDAAAQATRAQPASILCLGLRTELDALSAEMLAHALAAAGQSTRALPLEGWGKTLAKDQDAALAVRRIHLCTLNITPQTQARIMCRRLRRHWPNAQIVLVAWCGTGSLATAENLGDMGVDEVAFQLGSLVAQPPETNQPIGASKEEGTSMPSQAKANPA